MFLIGCLFRIVMGVCCELISREFMFLIVFEVFMVRGIMVVVWFEEILFMSLCILVVVNRDSGLMMLKICVVLCWSLCFIM